MVVLIFRTRFRWGLRALELLHGQNKNNKSLKKRCVIGLFSFRELRLKEIKVPFFFHLNG